MKEIQKLVDDFSSLKIKERTGLTFLEIAKCPHLENVWSNILAFYLNPNNDHNLFDLLLKSIFETAAIPLTAKNYSNIYVRTEYPTSLGNKIDIVTIADNFILGIENKVEADLYNDLKDYSNTINSLAKKRNLPSCKIVLSKYRKDVTDGFINITYTSLIRTIKLHIGNFTGYSDTKYLIFLIDFLNNIENNINSKSMADNLEVINFLRNNSDKVNKLLEYHDKFSSDLVKKLDLVHSAIKQDEIKTKLTSLNKQTQFGGPGRFTWQSSQLIKYNIVVNDISFFYQVGISDYKLHSYFWFSSDMYQFLSSKLEEAGVKESTYEYEESENSIAKNIQTQIDTIIRILDVESK